MGIPPCGATAVVPRCHNTLPWDGATEWLCLMLDNPTVPGFLEWALWLSLPGALAVALISICLFSKFYADWVAWWLEEVCKEVEAVKFPF